MTDEKHTADQSGERPRAKPLREIAEEQRRAAENAVGGAGTTDPGTSDSLHGAGGTTKGVVGAGGGSGINESELDDTTGGLGPGQ